MNTLYRQHIIKHAKNPMNSGKLEHADIRTDQNNVTCGDQIQVDVIFDSEDRVKEIAFQNSGCILSTASASILSQWLKEKTKKQVKELKEEDVFEVLGFTIETSRKNCAMLIIKALQKAI